MTSGKRYTEEFKVEAVKQVTERGYAVAEAAARLGVRRGACTVGLRSTAVRLASARRRRSNRPRFGARRPNCDA